MVVTVTAIYILQRDKFKLSAEKTEILMDTVVTIVVYGQDKNRLDNLLEQAFKKMKEYSLILSNYNPESEISMINKYAGVKPVNVSDLTIEFLEKSIELCKLTDGYLDITIGNLLTLWGFASDNPKLPSKFEIEESIKKKGFDKIKINKEEKTVFIEDNFISIDVGATAKGFIVDKITQFLSKSISKGALNAGGNIRFIGLKDKGKLWKVGIRDPFSEDRGKIIDKIEVGEWSVAASGDYERFFIQDGVKYHHILNPYTGYPANYFHSVTVTAKDAVTADGLSTAIFAMGEKVFTLDYISKFKKIDNFRVITIDSKRDIFDSEKD